MRVRFEGFCLDIERRELTQDDRVLHVTPKAFDLLALLVERRPRPVPQDDLFDHLWPDTLVDLSRLHQLVQELRTALHDEERVIIRTVYSRGFAFAAPAVQMDERPTSLCQLVVDDKTFDLREGENSIGRDYQASVRIDDKSVSRTHARLVVGSESVTVEDLGSRNGTFVNGRRIRSAKLANRDVMKVGHVEARFIIREPLDATE